MTKEVSEEASFEYAKQALPMMAQHGVKPTPNNYAVWYVYVSQGNDELAHEIDTIIREKMVFSPDICEYLYTKYVSDDDSRIVHETTMNMRQLIAETMSSISNFTGETDSYKRELEEHIEALPGQDDETVQKVVDAVMSRVGAMLESSGGLSDKLNESQKEIEELKENLAQVKTESEIDFLTGVYNRKALDQRFEEAIAGTEEDSLCLLMLDVDHFKAFNDKFGHLIGDEVLKIVARVLTDSVKGKDSVARFGGEEFAVLLPDTPIGGGMIVAEQIRKAIANKELKRKDTGENYGQITVSVGVAIYNAKEDTIPTFIKRADDALYRAKNSGRNCVVQQKMKDEDE